MSDSRHEEAIERLEFYEAKLGVNKKNIYKSLYIVTAGLIVSGVGVKEVIDGDSEGIIAIAAGITTAGLGISSFRDSLSNFAQNNVGFGYTQRRIGEAILNEGRSAGESTSS